MRIQGSAQKGSVSLFVVIFAALLIITIVTAFIRIMIQDQMQATASDLSKSAYDSAQAGVEDAKRAIVEYYQRDCPNAPGTDLRCSTLKAALIGDTNAGGDGWTTGCNATEKAGVATLTNSEVPVKTTSEDDELNQAYTCVKVQMNPSDYLGSLTPNTSRLLQLKAKDRAAFTQIKLQWYAQEGKTLDLGDGSLPYKLPDVWPTNRPAVMRVQLLQLKPGFKLSNFDNDSNFNASLYLLPSIAGVGGDGGAKAYFSQDSRAINARTGTVDTSVRADVAQPVACYRTPTDSRYACEVTIVLPDWGDPANAATRTAYLKIGQFYSTINTDFRVTMLNDAGEEQRFTDVQPAVDVTGRAGDLFRRIRSRIGIGSNGVPVPESAVDVTKSLCKEFLVTDTTSYPGNSAECKAPPVN